MQAVTLELVTPVPQGAHWLIRKQVHNLASQIASQHFYHRLRWAVDGRRLTAPLLKNSWNALFVLASMCRQARANRRVVNPLSHVLEKCTHTVPHPGRKLHDELNECFDMDAVRPYVHRAQITVRSGLRSVTGLV